MYVIVGTPQLQSEAGSRETFCTPGSVTHRAVLSFNTKHLLLGGSMDTRVKALDVMEPRTDLFSCGAFTLRAFRGHVKAVEDCTISNDSRKFCLVDVSDV